MRVSQDAVSATDLVPKRIRFFLQQNLPRIVLFLDDRFYDLAQAADDLLFLFAKRRLI